MRGYVDIPGYEGIYQINRQGEIYSVPRKLNIGTGTRFTRGRKLFGHFNPRTGYLAINLYNRQKVSPTGIHRLLAKTFIPNPENKPCVNHINGIKTDNRIENLEWCTHSENRNHAVKMGLGKVFRVKQMTLDGRVVRIWESANEAVRNHFPSAKKAVEKNKIYLGFKWQRV